MLRSTLRVCVELMQLIASNHLSPRNDKIAHHLQIVGARRSSSPSAACQSLVESVRYLSIECTSANEHR